MALVDTSFNGEFMISEGDARDWGFSLVGDFSSVQLAAGVEQEVRAGVGRIVWLNRTVEIDILVTPDSPSRRADDPIALIGTMLLSPDVLHIDFEERTVEIYLAGS